MHLISIHLTRQLSRVSPTSPRAAFGAGNANLQNTARQSTGKSCAFCHPSAIRTKTVNPSIPINKAAIAILECAVPCFFPVGLD